MRLLFVVQRYGHEVSGGAESACRQFATRLAGLGSQVEVLTSRAIDYIDWADAYPPGSGVIDGVRVHRLGVRAPRDDERFGALNARVVWGEQSAAPHLQAEWMRLQGPELVGQTDWLGANAASFDAVIFFTYLYNSTWTGLRATAGRAVTVLHPTLHDEPPMYLPLFDHLFRLPSAFAFATEEEGALANRRFGITPVLKRVIGIGADVEAQGDPNRFRARIDATDAYLLYVGRVDPSKGTTELFDFFTTYKARRPSGLKLVIIGDGVRPLDPHPDVVVTGVVDDRTKRDAMAGATALVQPSYFESFAMGLIEAWAEGTPALVQGRCDVLAGQVHRSHGGLAYSGYAEFEAAVDLLHESPALRSALGAAGRTHVRANYSWPAVMSRYEGFLRYVTWRLDRRTA